MSYRNVVVTFLGVHKFALPRRFSQRRHDQTATSWRCCYNVVLAGYEVHVLCRGLLHGQLIYAGSKLAVIANKRSTTGKSSFMEANVLTGISTETSEVLNVGPGSCHLTLVSGVYFIPRSMESSFAGIL